MLGKLNKQQINNLLLSQSIGHLGYTDGLQPYIVPVTYVFDGKFIYGQTGNGMKLELMRKNPKICFQVERMLNMANWQSVLILGTFVELKGKAAESARSYLTNHVLPLLTSSTIHPHQHAVKDEIDDSNQVKPVMYKLKIKKMTGRFEKQ